MGAPSPLVSVVVPTRGRPDLVVRAVTSALGQTVAEIEVIVAIDGPDAVTAAALERLGDPRLNVLELPVRLGNGGARNAAVAAARADHVALLDDDDWWMTTKLEHQLAAAASSGLEHPIVSCRMIGRCERGDLHWPRRLPRPAEPVSEYLFRRSSPFSGEGIAQTSTLLTTRALLLAVPFDATIPRYVDIDWILRAARHPGTGLVFAESAGPLSVWSMEASRPRISGRADADYTLAFARARRPLFTPRAYAGFILWLASKNAAQARRGRAFVPLIWEATRHGRPGLADLATHGGNFALSQGARDRAAALNARVRVRLGATAV
jgi:glycosyltransferase involved in cell wall biosynthesis